jgi:hypothetical protein
MLVCTGVIFEDKKINPSMCIRCALQIPNKKPKRAVPTVSATHPSLPFRLHPPLLPPSNTHGLPDHQAAQPPAPPRPRHCRPPSSARSQRFRPRQGNPTKGISPQPLL